MPSPTSKFCCCLICFLSYTQRTQWFVRDKLQRLILLLDLMRLVQWFCFDGFTSFTIPSRLLVFWETGLLWWVNFLCSNFMGLKLIFFFFFGIKKLNLLGNQFFFLFKFVLFLYEISNIFLGSNSLKQLWWIDMWIFFTFDNQEVCSLCSSMCS